MEFQIPPEHTRSEPTPLKDILALEEQLGVKLPAAYHQLLTTLGHGPYFYPYEKNGEETWTYYKVDFQVEKDGRWDDVSFSEGLLPVKEVKGYLDDLVGDANEEEGRLAFIPFIIDMCGNPVCFHYIEEGEEPKIVKYDYDYGVVSVADNFESLMSMASYEID